MNSNKIIPILGLLLLLILAIGSISAADADMDSNSIDDNLASVDLTEEGQSVNFAENSNIDDEVTVDSIQSVDSADDNVDSSTFHSVDSADEEVAMDSVQSVDSINDDVDSSNIISADDNADTISNTDDAIGDDVEQNSVGVKNTVKSSNLASTYKLKNNNYNVYFNRSGNIISGKLNSGDTLDFSGSFSDKNFTIDIPLILTSTDGTAVFTNCGFKFIAGSDGSNISNLNAKQIKNENSAVISANSVSNLTFTNNTIFSNKTKSFPMSFTNVSGIKVFNNTVQSNSYANVSQPSVMCFFGGSNCNISGNTVIINDSNGIYFSTFGSDGGAGANSQNSMSSNYIFNNTVYSIRTLPSSFGYGIQVMGPNNFIINNTLHDLYRGISCDASGNQIIGNVLYNIHGAYLSSATAEEGGDYSIIAGSNCIVKDNLIFDSNIRETGAAIGAGDNSNISGNVVRNISGIGVRLTGSNISFINNSLNVTSYGAHITENASNVVLEANVFDTGDASSVRLIKKSRMVFPHDIIIQNNTFYTLADKVIDADSVCKNIFISNNIIIGSSGIPEQDDENTTHYINEINFYKYFDATGTLGSRIKENDTLIFIGPISSKGKLNINNKVTIKGQDAVFNDTTFIINDNDVLIENIAINNPNLDNMDRLWGIQVNGSNNVTIQNCSISIYDSFSAYAIYLLEASNCTIVNNSLEARGNYFTVAVLSFNSHDIYLDGNTLKTIGCGEAYLINNKSCLDGYLNIYADTCVDGAVVCPDGYTICPDGSLLCPDGVTTINAEDYRICVDGSIVCTDGSIICPDGSTIPYSSSDICADGSVCVDGVTYCIDGTILYADGSKRVAGGYLVSDNSIVCPDGTVYGPGEFTTCVDGSIVCPDGTVICADGSVVCVDGSTICPDGSTICADGTMICADGSIVCTDGTMVCPDGSIVCPDGTVYGPGEYTTCVDGSIVCPDGTVIYPNGTIVCADGTVVCPDGSASSTILDGVIPGSHMVSGVYRTYGFLMIHSSNVTFTNNIVDVSSALGTDYNLNESYNSIAGVFIHYGGFNNNISNNIINVSSNDPVIYGIGIIGATMNSTAIGSVNNTFSYNNISINGSFLTVGLLLGNKAINSTIVFNNFSILSGKPCPNIVNYNESAQNTVENNIFYTKAKTVFAFENITVDLRDLSDSLSFEIVLKDNSGNPLANKAISFTFNGLVTNKTTDENGKATISLSFNDCGIYNVSMKFEGDEDYFKSSAVAKVTVKSYTSLSVTKVSYKTTNNKKVVTATILDEKGNALANKTIVFTISGKKYTAKTNSQGKASIKADLSAGGNYTVSASFAGDSVYYKSSASGKLTLTKVSTSLKSSGKTYRVTLKSKSIAVTLKDADGNLIKGKKISAIVNGKTYSATTNAKGVATIKLTLNKVKTFKVSLKFAGDKVYSGSTSSIKVKVIKTKTKLAVPKKTYKKSAKVKKLTATLKDQDGKFLKSKKVKFTVNGKTFTKTTNKKGVATLKVKLSKKKTYNFKVKFAGDSKYSAVTKKGKVIIK